jgi:hypothetical protein
LADLEEEGVFTFFSARQLAEMLEGAGFAHVETFESFGDPPQAVIVRARKAAP